MLDFSFSILSSAQRRTLADLEKIKEAQKISQRRLSTGERETEDSNPVAYFRAKALESLAQEHINDKEKVQYYIDNLSSHVKSLVGVETHLKEMSDILQDNSVNTLPPDDFKPLMESFYQSAALAYDTMLQSSIDGNNLLKGTNKSVLLRFGASDDPQTLLVKGYNLMNGITSGMMTPARRALFYMSWTKQANGSVSLSDKFSTLIWGSQMQLDNYRGIFVEAIQRIRSLSTEYAGQVSLLKNRLSFTSSMADLYTDSAGRLNSVVNEEESAKISALQVRAQLAVEGMRILLSMQNLVLRLFS